MSTPTLPKRHIYLTKGRFLLAVECPTKLKYFDDTRYTNANNYDDFLLALAQFGHQVGALGRTLFPGGTLLEEADHALAWEKTIELLSKPNVIIYEAAVLWENCFIRVDVLEKRGDALFIYEVKAKSYDTNKGDSQIVGRSGFLSEFKPYIYDVTFQRFVTRNAFPHLSVSASLVFVNKRAISEVAVLEKLKIHRAAGRISIEVDGSLQGGAIARTCLSLVPADEFADKAERDPLNLGAYVFPFAEGVSEIMRRLDSGEPFPPQLGAYCKSCEFRTPVGASQHGQLDGRSECWSSVSGATVEELVGGSVLHLHNCRFTNDLLSANRYLLSQLTKDDIKLKEEPDKLSLSARHWLQSEECRGNIADIEIKKDLISQELARATFPLHFIDFETARPVLPLHPDRRPYELVFFQFSDHLVTSDGHITHAHEFLYDPDQGFPNLEVLRHLRSALANDNGSVIHWWDHERNTLLEIKKQLEASHDSTTDRSELIAFIDSLVGTGDAKGRLLDLGRLFERCCFVPGTRGSSSLKRVLVPLLSLPSTSQLRDRFSHPNYGFGAAIASLNFEPIAWVKRDANGTLVDPYRLLGRRFSDDALDKADELDDEQVVADGGAAMVAYVLLESGMLDTDQIEALRKQLKRYCELDTLAMVMAWQAIQGILARNPN